jgi:RNA polymerase sigma-70 factor, ECF subfamily
MNAFRPSHHLDGVRCAPAREEGFALVAEEAAVEPAASELPLDFSSVYGRHFDDVLCWIRAFGAPKAEVEDLAQEVFVVVRRKLSSFDGANLPGWLYKIAKLTVRDHGRRAWFRRIFRGRRAVEFDDLPSVSGDPEALFEQRETHRLFYRLVAQMNEQRRETFLLYEVEGYSGEEIAQLQGVPLGTVWTRLHRARAEFVSKVKKLRPEGGRP